MRDAVSGWGGGGQSLISALKRLHCSSLQAWLLCLCCLLFLPSQYDCDGQANRQQPALRKLINKAAQHSSGRSCVCPCCSNFFSPSSFLVVFKAKLLLCWCWPLRCAKARTARRLPRVTRARAPTSRTEETSCNAMRAQRSAIVRTLTCGRRLFDAVPACRLPFLFASCVVSSHTKGNSTAVQRGTVTVRNVARYSARRRKVKISGAPIEVRAKPKAQAAADESFSGCSVRPRSRQRQASLLPLCLRDRHRRDSSSQSPSVVPISLSLLSRSSSSISSYAQTMCEWDCCFSLRALLAQTTVCSSPTFPDL